MRRFAPAVLVVALVGCYTFSGSSLTAPEVGKEMRVQLTLTGGDSLARFVGPNVATIDGKLLNSSDDGVEVGVTQVVTHDGLEQYWKGESVMIPRQFIASIQERKFSYLKTGLLVGIVIVVASVLKGSGALGGTGGNSGGGGGGQQ